MMGRAIVADQPSAVHREDHRQVLKADVVDDLIVRSLKESRVDGHHGPHAGRRQAGGEGHRVLLAQAHVEAAAGETAFEALQACAIEHRGGDGDYAVIVLGDLGEGLAEDLAVCGPACVIGRLSGAHLERPGAVEPARVALGGLVTLALGREHMHQHRARHADCAAEDLHERLQVVPINRPQVGEAQVLEEHPRYYEPLHAHPEVVHRLDHRLAHRHAPEHPGHVVPRPAHRGRDVRPEAREHSGQRPHVARDAHLVVVEHDGDVRARVAGLVEALQGQPTGQRAVADHRHDALRAAPQVAGHGESQRRRDRGAPMSRPEGVVLALLAHAEARQPVELPQPVEASLPPGEQLVRVALVAHVPDDLVPGGIQHVVQRQGQLNHPEVGRKVAPGLGGGLDDPVADLVGQRAQLAHRQALHIRRRFDLFKPLRHRYRQPRRGLSAPPRQ